jgi:hypothetical protein
MHFSYRSTTYTLQKSQIGYTLYTTCALLIFCNQLALIIIYNFLSLYNYFDFLMFL